MSGRYFATTRQLTGTPYIFYAYVYDRETGKVVASCMHRHGERRSHNPATGATIRRGDHAAKKCAERMLRRLLKRQQADGEG